MVEGERCCNVKTIKAVSVVCLMIKAVILWQLQRNVSGFDNLATLRKCSKIVQQTQKA